MEDIAELRAKLEAAQQRRNELEAQREQEAEVEQVKREIEDLEKLEELEAEYGPLDEGLAKVIVADRFTIYLKRAPKIIWSKYMSRKDNALTYNIELVKPCVVSPSVAEVSQLGERYPVLWYACANALNRLAGYRKDQFEGE